MTSSFVLNKSETVFNLIRDIWENPETQKKISSLMVFVFLAVLVVIELGRHQIFPESIQSHIPVNHLQAIDFAFNLLLIKEVFDLILYLPRSISNAQRKQLQILSLILIRFAFKSLSQLGEPVTISTGTDSVNPIFEILAGSLGSLVIFVIIHFFYKIKNQPLLVDPVQRDRFIAEKKLVANVLIIFFFSVGIYYAPEIFFNFNLEPAMHIFFTIFIFGDILIVLISLQYSQLFLTMFRNSGFALATVIARISITAPPYYREALAIFSAIFSFLIAFVYNKSIVDVLDYLESRKKMKDVKPLKKNKLN